jgi:hypothetical protein
VLVKKTCQRMSDAGQIHPADGGRYIAPDPNADPLPIGDVSTAVHAVPVSL